MIYSWFKALTIDTTKIKYIKESASANAGSYYIYPQQPQKGLLYAVQILEHTLTPMDRQVLEKIGSAESQELNDWKSTRQ